MADSQQTRSTAQAQDAPLERGPKGGEAHPEPDHSSHGQSLASWTGVGLIMFGALVMAIAVVVTTVWLFVVGAVIVVGGVVTGKVLSAMGFGVSGKPGH